MSASISSLTTNADRGVVRLQRMEGPQTPRESTGFGMKKGVLGAVPLPRFFKFLGVPKCVFRHTPALLTNTQKDEEL